MVMRWLARSHAHARADVVDPGIAAALRNVMDSIVVVPTGYRQDYMVDAHGRLSAIMGIDNVPDQAFGRGNHCRRRG
jgi:hypothetical protein